MTYPHGTRRATTGVRAWLAIAAAAVLVSCGGSVDSPSSSISPQAWAYLDAALDTMQHNSINRYKIGWTQYRVEAFGRAAGAQTPADTYTAIHAAVAGLDDRHSRFYPPGSAPDRAPPDVAPASSVATYPTGLLLADRYGYLSVPSFSSVTSADVSAFSDSLLHLVGSLDAQHACGWIVDLRGNLGGNMWPMLLGVEPILGDGEVGAFVDPDSVRSTWFSSPGSVGTRDANGDTTYVHTSDIPPVRLTQAMPPVAVLTDSLTASSGEAIAVAFRGRPGARSFGSPTFGVPTANHGYTLSDGALLLLTVAADADRTGRVYTDQLVPDEPIPPGTGPFAYDTVSVAAQAWLAAQPVCTSH